MSLRLEVDLPATEVTGHEGVPVDLDRLQRLQAGIKNISAASIHSCGELGNLELPQPAAA